MIGGGKIGLPLGKLIPPSIFGSGTIPSPYPAGQGGQPEQTEVEPVGRRAFSPLGQPEGRSKSETRFCGREDEKCAWSTWPRCGGSAGRYKTVAWLGVANCHDIGQHGIPKMPPMGDRGKRGKLCHCVHESGNGLGERRNTDVVVWRFRFSHRWQSVTTQDGHCAET